VSLSAPSEAAHKLRLRSLGHACAVLYRDGEAPLLATDPWLLGSVYWRSWWLQRITMFVRIRLLRRLDPRKVYALFVLFQFDDYGHLRSVASLLRWVSLAIRYTLLLRLPLPQPEKHHP